MNEIGIAGWAFNRAILRDKSLTLLDFPKLARDDYGVQTIELVSTFFESQTAKYLNQLREAIETAGVRVHNIAVDTGHLGNPDPMARKVDVEAIKQWFHVARALGSSAIRVNTGEGSLDDIMAGYEELLRHAEESQVRLLIENHGGASSDPKVIEQILKRFDSKWFGACPDVQNFHGDTWEQGMRAMAPRSYAVHFKVTGYDPSGRQEWTARDGQPRRVDLKKCLAILKEAGYAGPINFEYNQAEEDEREGVRKGIEYTKKLLAA